MKAHERLLHYVTHPSASSPHSGEHPSTPTQLTFAKHLCEELTALGCERVHLDAHGYVYAALPASAGCEGVARLGLIAHMDTSPDFEGAGVRPQLIPCYDGEDVPLSDSGRVLSRTMFSHLGELRGRTLITTDGHTLLGADDKAGIAEIMTVIERLQTEGIPHGPLRFAFTPDEEIGEGADFFDVERFDADFAYTVDGGPEGHIEYENFNAASATFTFHGVNVHPGSAKDTMRNASLVAMELAALLPPLDTPTHTEGYEGFFHLTDMSGTVEQATLSYIVRDHDASLFEARKAMLVRAAEQINRRYGDGAVELYIEDSYRNMIEQIRPHMHLIDNAKAAAKAVGLTPVVEAIRGGTDGARLSFMGLPCPNLGTGGYAFHGPYEHITVEGMELTVQMMLALIGLYST